METTTTAAVAAEPNPWIGMPVLDPPAEAEDASSQTVTDVADDVEEADATTTDTVMLRRRVAMRTRRLAIANASAIVAAASAVACLFGPWWTFTMTDMTMTIPQAGGGFTTMPIKGTHAELSGVSAGGTTVVVLMVAAAVLAAVASWKRWWPLAIVPLLLMAPGGPGVPPAAPPASVATPQSLGAQLTEAAGSLRALRVIWWVEVMLLVAVAIQGFVVWRAARAVTRAENPEAPSFMSRNVDRFVGAALARIGVEVAKNMKAEKADTRA
jgi:hypothetical protein